MIHDHGGIKNPNYKHGMKGTRFYRIYKNIENRCNNKNFPHYRLYGNRGIRCRWSNFIDFKNDMYESYIQHVQQFEEKNTSIDRIDNNSHYSKDNCRWATTTEQASNKRNNHIIAFKGKSMILNEWARHLNVPRERIKDRIRAGWSIEKALLSEKLVNQYK